MRKKNNKYKEIYKYLSIVLVIVSLLTMGLLFFLNVLPGKFFFIASAIIAIINIILINWLRKKSTKRIVSTILSIVLIIGMIACIFYEINTLDFLSKIGSNKFKKITYELVVLNNNDYSNVDDLENKFIGLLNTTESDYNQAVKFLKKKIEFKEEKYEDIGLIADELLTKEIDAMLIEQSRNNILKEENSDYQSKTKVIYSFDIEVAIENIVKKVDVTKDSFNIYLSGIDTYGTVNSVSRSDVNIIASINPVTKKVHFTSIPRDYYVKLHSKAGYKDKLTHAGIYGVEESVNTIEDLLNMDINYYVKVNFTSLIDIVDAIGPITVYSNYDFETGIYDKHTVPYTFNKGKNILNGSEALAFARERKAFASGDRVRNENQQLVLEGIVDKILSPAILAKYPTLLDSLSNAFVTNMTDEEITSIIKQQLDTNASWKVTSYVLEGNDDYDYTYSYKSAKSYVMVPDRESVNESIKKINEILITE